MYTNGRGFEERGVQLLFHFSLLYGVMEVFFEEVLGKHHTGRKSKF